VTTHRNCLFKTILMSGNSIGFGEEIKIVFCKGCVIHTCFCSPYLVSIQISVADLKDRSLSEHVAMYMTATEKVLDMHEERKCSESLSSDTNTLRFQSWSDEVLLASKTDKV